MKEITIYRKNGSIRQKVLINPGSKLKYTLGKEDCILLKFSSVSPIPFKLGDYVSLVSDIPSAEIYELTELPTPTYDNSTGGYNYEVRFDAHYYKWRNKIFKYTPENANSEASWSLTAPLHTHLEVFLRNLKTLGYKYKNQDYIYVIDSSVESKSVAITYSNENMLDALFSMGGENAWNCDVWVQGNEIHFGHCESGNAVQLRRGIEVSSSQRSESKGIYATRLFAFGGERNIPRSYGKRLIDATTFIAGGRMTGQLANTNYYLAQETKKDIVFLSGKEKDKTFHVTWRYGFFYFDRGVVCNASVGDKFELLNFPEEVPDRYLSYGADGLTVNGVVQKRLMLPRSTPYIDVYPDMTTEEAIEAVVIFDDIYPKRVGTLANVTPVPRDVKDGDKVIDKFTAYQYTDSGLTFKDEYIIEGEELKITFQGNSKLSGMTFGVQFDPDGKKEQKWEIIRNEDYGRPLPDEVLKPENGDEYVLSGFNIKLVSDSYIATAEKELETKARQYAEKIKNDDGTFTVTMNPVWVHDNNKYFACGQKVTFTDDAMFSGSRDLRVLGYEINLDIPYDNTTYTIGQSMPFSRLGNIETQLEAVTFKGSTYVGGGSGGNGSNIYVVKRDDETEPSDFNVFSALRSLKTLIRKDKDDTTEFLLTLLKGAVFGNGKGKIDESGAAQLLSAVFGGGTSKVNADGSSQFKSVVVRDGVTSDNFATGASGSGFTLEKDENNDTYLEVDRMFVRKTATFVELLIQRLRHVGGQIILSPASMTCERVEDRSDVYRCYFRSSDGSKTIANEFVVGDQARCQTFNIKSGVHQGVQNQYYWRLVTAVGDNYVDLSKTDQDGGSTAPKAGDDIVQLGHRSDVSRQCAIVLAAHGAGAPYIKMYRGINSYAMDGKEIITLSREEVSIIANKLQFSTGVNVETAVNNAQNTASNASQKADKAQGTADSAQSAASKAQGAADSAQNTANNASGKADQAQSAADKAQGTADNASQKADNAQNTANTANSNASKVGSDLQVFQAETNGKFEANDRKFVSNLAESKLYADGKFDNLQVGGRNLLQIKTMQMANISPNDGSFQANHSGIDWTCDFIPVKPNEQLTLSLHRDIDRTADYFCGQFWAYDVNKVGISSLISNIKWDRNGGKQTVNTPGNAAFVRCSLIRGNELDTWKLERGNKATDWSPAPEDTASKIETNASSITQLADEINLNVQKTTEIDGRLVTAESNITQTAENITLKVERQVGGENLLYNSSFVSDLVGWRTWGVSSEMTAQIVNKDKTVDWLQGFPCLELWTALRRGIWRPVIDQTFKIGDKITVSFDMMKRNPWPYEMCVGADRAGEAGYLIDITNHPINEWKRVSVTQEIVEAGDVNIMIYGDRNVAGVVYIKDMKVERGSVATTWCPAPSEQHDKLLATGIDILNEKIVLTANNTVIQSNKGQRIAMFTEDSNGKPWIKGENVDAKNLVSEQMHTKSSDGTMAHVEVSGSEINIFGNIARNIQFGVNSDGYAVLKYFDNEGRLLYDLGPKGIVNTPSQEERWESVWLRQIGSSTTTIKDVMTISGLRSEYKKWEYNAQYERYLYHSKMVAGVYDDAVNNGLTFIGRGKLEGNRLNGIFVSAPSRDGLNPAWGEYKVDPSNPGGQIVIPGMSLDNEPIYNRAPLYFATLLEYRNGRAVKTQVVYWNG